MKKIFLLTVCATTLLIAGPQLLNAQPEPASSPARERLWNPARLKEKLGLTDDQVAKIRIEVRAQKGQLKEHAQHIQAARADLRQAVQSNASEQKIRTAATALGVAQGDFALARAALFARIAPILTPEQIAKFHEMQANR